MTVSPLFPLLHFNIHINFTDTTKYLYFKKYSKVDTSSFKLPLLIDLFIFECHIIHKPMTPLHEQNYFS